MPHMYEVYTQPRQGRPRWALAASALLLLITVGLAQALITYKTRAQQISLDPPRIYEEGRIRCALPRGWKSKSPEDLPWGAVAGVIEPPEDKAPVRQLFILRDVPHSYGVPSLDARDAALQAVENLTSDIRMAQDLGAGKVGSLPGWTVGSVAQTVFGGGRPSYCIARSAIAPAGQIVTIVLLLSQQVRNADRQLLDAVAETVELLDVSLTTDSAEAMRRSGLHFEPPPGSRFADDSVPESPVLRMTGGDGDACWFVNAYRIPLLEGRTIETIAADLIAMQRQSRQNQALEIQEVDGREVARADVVLRSDKKSTVQVWCAKTGEREALLVVGRHDPAAADTLRDVCRSIAGSAKIDGGPALPDVKKARDRARECLRQLADSGLTTAWNHWKGTNPAFRLVAPALQWGRERRVYDQHRGRDGKPWWDLTIVTKLEGPRLPAIATTEEWSIRSDLAAHQLTLDRTLSGRVQLQYTEARAPGDRELVRTLSLLAPAGQLKRTTPIDDTFACEPVLLQAAGLVARDEQKRTAIFQTTDAFSQDVVYWVAVPLGELPVPGPAKEQRAAAVRLQRDFHPDPIILYFSTGGTLVGIARDDCTWQELAAPPAA